MIKASVMYPNGDDAQFDHDYYRDTHIPLIKSLMGDAIVQCNIDKGLSGGPDVPPPFVCMVHIVCNSIEEFRAGFFKNSETFAKDVPNFTNIQPTLQISEVVE